MLYHAATLSKIKPKIWLKGRKKKFREAWDREVTWWDVINKDPYLRTNILGNESFFLGSYGVNSVFFLGVGVRVKQSSCWVEIVE